MRTQLTEPLAGRSFWHRADPRWKMGCFLLAALPAAGLTRLSAVSAGLMLAAMALASLRLPWSWWRDRLFAVGGLLLLLWLLLPWSHPGTAINLGPIGVSEAGLHMAALLSARWLLILGLIVLFLTTSPFERYLQAALACGCPSQLVHLGLLSYRYAHLFAEELNHRRIALRLRGFRNQMSRHAYRTIGQVAGSILVRGHDRAERVAQAMQCRGFQGRVPMLTPFESQWRDLVMTLAVLLGLALVLVLEWR